MLDQNTFMETVRSVMEITKTSATPLPKEEILGYFSDMELTESQKDMVYEYFLHPQEEETQEEREIREREEAEEKKEEEQQEEMEREVEEAEREVARETGTPVEVVEADPDTIFFQMYLEDIESLPKYSEQQEEELYQKLAEGEADAIQELTNCWMQRVLDLARKNRARKVHLEDIIQEGNIGLFLKLQELLGAGVKKDAKTILSDAVVEAMKAYISEVTGEDDSESTILGKATLVHEAKALLTEELGHTPSMQELADYTKMTAEELEGILSVVKEKGKNENGTV